MPRMLRHRRLRQCAAPWVAAFTALAAPLAVHATEGALGRQVTGTSVQPNAGIVSPEPIWAVNFAEIYLDGKVGGGRDVPLGKRVTADVEGKVAFTLATLLKTWDTGPGRWNFASSITLPYVWTKVNAKVAGPLGRGSGESDTTSNLFDLYFSPIIAGYHVS